MTQGYSRRTLLLTAAALAAAGVAGSVRAAEEELKPDEKRPIVVMETTLGSIEIQLDAEKAPITTKNFLQYVKDGFYDGLVFHRVIPDFMIQGGGMTAELKEKKTREPIRNEAGNGLKNERGTIAMARTRMPDSATAQFFINVKKNDFLDHKDDTEPGFGYAVFGKVIKGMDVVDKIVAVPTTNKGPYSDVPVKPVVIKSAKLKSPPARPEAKQEK
jgi:cyclophilin family peptidyl-prolyl cis-trans isomerase